MRVPPTSRLYLFGGGSLLCTVAGTAAQMGFDVQVVTAPRHDAESVAPGRTFAQAIDALGVPRVVVERLDASAFPDADRACALSFGAAWVFTQPVIDRFGGKLFNVHSARLPNDRGAGGYSWQILRDNRFGYCLIHQIDSGLDSGPVVAFEEYLHAPSCRIPEEYFAESEQHNERFISEFLRRLRAGTDLEPRAQNETLSLYWPRLSTADQGYIDWSWTASDIERFACAFDRPYMGAGTFHQGTEVRLRDVWLSREEHSFHPFQAGIVFRKSHLGLHVAAIGGSLLVRDARTRDGAPGADQIRVGERLFTPSSILDAARGFRAVYRPTGPVKNEG